MSKELKETEKDNSLDGFFFNLLLFCVVIVFPITLTILTFAFWD